MGIRSKIIGLVAAAVLTFSMGGAAFAQYDPNTDDQVAVTATLLAGTCSVGIVEGANSMDYGTWVYQDGAWVKQADQSAYKGVHIEVKTHRPGGECNIYVSMWSGMKGVNPANVIGQDYLFLNFYSTLGVGESALPKYFQAGAGTHKGSLNVRIPTNAQPDTYVGTLQAEAANGQ